MNRDHTIKALTCTVALGTVATLGFASVSQAEEQIRWRFPSAFGTNLISLGTPAADFADNLERATNGRIQVRVYEPGELVDAFEVLDAVSTGRVQAGFGQPIYDQGTIPAAPLFASVPFGPKAWSYTAWWFHGDGQELMKEVYANHGYEVHPILCGLTGPETAGWYSEPITSVDDYDGMTIRFAGLGGRVVEKFGASVTMTPGGELFQALERGVIDAVEFSMPAVDQIIGFQDVVNYNMFPGWHQTHLSSYVLVNNDVWENTSEADQVLIENICTATALRGLVEGEAANGRVLAELEEEGVNLEMIPEDVLRELKRASEEVMQAEADRDDDFRRVWESQQEFMETYSIWERRGYLPPESVDW